MFHSEKQKTYISENKDVHFALEYVSLSEGNIHLKRMFLICL